MGVSMEYGIFVSCIVICAIVGVAIGANDVANSFSTSVGSGAMSLNVAIILAFIFEMLGAALLGASVTTSIKTNIIDLTLYKGQPRVLSIGMLSSSISILIWISAATYAALPISTTHSIIGSIIGFGIASGHGKSINWVYLSLVFLSWLVAPILAIVTSCLVYILVLKIMEKHSKYLYHFTFVFSAITCLPVSLLLSLKHPFHKHGTEDVSAFVYFINEYKPAVFVIVYVSLIVITTLIAMYITKYRSQFGHKLHLENFFNNDQKNQSNTFDQNSQRDVEGLDEAVRNFVPPKAEILFSSLQLISATMNIISHASNDAANAAMPVSVLLALYYDELNIKYKVSWYVLLGSGVSMSIGLALFGTYVMNTVGFKLTRVIPSRGYTIDSVASTIMLTLSYIGMPMSSTHCVVSSTMGVGIVLDKKREDSELQDSDNRGILYKLGLHKRLSFDRVNVSLYKKILLMWLVTIFLSATTSVLVFLLFNAVLA